MIPSCKFATPDSIKNWDKVGLTSDDVLALILDSADGPTDFQQFAGEVLKAMVSFDEETGTYRIKYDVVFPYD